jgi:hypothetical protein
MTDDAEATMVDEYVDCTGQVRRFRLIVYAGGAFLDAIELKDGEPIGLRLVEPISEGEGEAFARIRRRIRAFLARSDVAVDPRTRELVLLCDRVRVQISGSGADTSREGLTILVDDRELTWAELGALFASYEGFFLDIAVRDPSEVE